MLVRNAMGVFVEFMREGALVCLVSILGSVGATWSGKGGRRGPLGV